MKVKLPTYMEISVEEVIPLLMEYIGIDLDYQDFRDYGLGLDEKGNNCIYLSINTSYHGSPYYESKKYTDDPIKVEIFSIAERLEKNFEERKKNANSN